MNSSHAVWCAAAIAAWELGVRRTVVGWMIGVVSPPPKEGSTPAMLPCAQQNESYSKTPPHSGSEEDDEKKSASAALDKRCIQRRVVKLAGTAKSEWPARLVRTESVRFGVCNECLKVFLKAKILYLTIITHSSLQVLALRTGKIILVLERCVDRSNAAAIFRTCESLGVQEIWEIASSIEKRKGWKEEGNKKGASYIYMHTRLRLRIRYAALVQTAAHILLRSEMVTHRIVGQRGLKCFTKLVRKPLPAVTLLVAKWFLSTHRFHHGFVHLDS